MKTTIKRRIAIGAAGLTVIAGGSGAYALASDDDPKKEREAFLNDAADRLNVSPEQLNDALKEALKDRIDQAAKDGRLTQEQANRIKERIDQDGLPLFGPGLRGGPGPGFHHDGGGPLFGAIDAAAKYLGLTRAQLREQFLDGKSLAEIAKERNKSVDGLKAAIRKAVADRLDQAVKDKLFTDAQRDRMLAELDDHLDEIVNREGPRVGFGRHRHGWGPPPGLPGGP
jgi:hypothetical protein